MTFPPGGGQGFPNDNVLVNPIVIGALLFYSPNPGAGNLVASISFPNGGTDPYGNTYPAGISVGKLGQQQVQLLLTSLIGSLAFPSGASFENNFAVVEAAVGGVSPAQYIAMAILGASTTTAGARDRVGIQLNSAAQDNSSSANMDLLYIGSNGTEHEYAFVDITGMNILAGSIVGVDPGSSPATPATWHTIALQNSYTAGTNNGFLDVPQVRQNSENKKLEFKGSLTVPAAPASNVWGLLPTGFPNANLGGPFGYGKITNYSGGTSDMIAVQNNANLSLSNGTAHGGATFNLCCEVPTQ